MLGLTHDTEEMLLLLSCTCLVSAAATAAAAAADDGPLMYESLVQGPATVLLQHCARVGFDAADSSATRDNIRFITQLMKRWGSRVTLTGTDGQTYPLHQQH